MTKVALIGARGWLGQGLVSAMNDCDVREVDIAALAGENSQRGDVRLAEDMERAVAGMDAVVHLVAWHGGYNPPPTNEARFDVNILGTFRVLQACLKHDVRRVVFASSMSAHSPGSFYGMTKIIGEDLCRHYHLGCGFHIAMMRYGAFTPCDLVSYGRRLLGGGVDRRDCVEATLAALRAVIDGRVGLGAYTVMADHPFDDDERAGGNIAAAVESHWPGHEDLLERHGIALPAEVPRYDLQPAQDDLDWRPRYNFGTFLSELRQKDEAGLVRPDSPRWCFETGTPAPEGVVWPEQ